ncbi:outer membrane protein assembly factor BamB family protein [Adhaeretor mobilis]|uniref:Outer membrane protein assembly factor BamB n=1 Tax=Adhaeretor mobilis TaxID=1930276 RepID=A0A517MR65_9BACT|nr:PQQ-binding-like beta-propeller repeat protein [Adhaeretor mobilis]QDS97383.1 Outer membrane protein assembly factor BamB [Adhaeretor mobilis]
MSYKLSTIAVLLCSHIFSASASLAQEQETTQWPRWRGPIATGVAPDGDPPMTWDEDTNVKWKVPIPGQGSGSPIVFDDKIYLLSAIKTDRTQESDEAVSDRSPASPFRLVQTESDRRPRGERPRGERPDGERPRGERPEGERRRGGRRGGSGRAANPTHFHQFVVLCLDRKTGHVLWQETAAEVVPHEGHHATASYASTSAVTDGKNLYVSFGSRGVYSYDLEGNFRWKHEMPPLYTRNSFGEGSSPALYGDTLVVNSDHEQQSFIEALDTNTGEPRWKTLRDEETSWGTPLIVEHEGVVQVIVNAMNRTRSYDLATGEVIWECGGQASGPVPTAVVHDNLVFCMTGHRGSALYAIPLSARGDITGSDKIAWKLDRDTPYVPSPLIYDDLLYFTKTNSAMLTCVKAATGEVQYRSKRLPGMDSIYASPVAASGRIYIAGRNGMTDVIKPGPKFEVLAENELGESIDATPAIVGKEIFIRGANHLYCIATD